jgi:glycosyltransferase involved in cell wall biosynthesis|tara:strand:- start:661 stop:1812 length:1152 start_codon:yes stop_codon:yes gene_type:complete
LIFIRKIKSGIFHFNVFVKKLKTNTKAYFAKKSISKWLFKINKDFPKVLIGANVLKPNGVDFHIHAIHKLSQKNIRLIPSDTILKKISSNDFFKNYIDKIEPNYSSILHSHVYPNYIIWCQTQKLLNPNIKWIHTYHLHYYNAHGNGELLDWQKEFNRVFIEDASKADVKISVSKWEQKLYKEKFNIDTLYIPNGVDVVKCEKANADVFYKNYGLKNFILNVSRHDPVKNPKEFVLLAQSMPEYDFVIIGNGLTEELFKKHYCISKLKNLSILGKMSQLEVQHAIAASSCLVSTSKKEGLPTLVLEGMAQSKPVVVSNEPGSMEAIDHGKYGYFYELGNIQDLKNQTLLAIEDTIKPVKARQRVLQEYDWRIVIKKLDRLYDV